MKKTISTLNQKKFAYIGLIFVIFIWGISPLVSLYFYRYYSPTIRVAFNALVCVIALIIVSRDKLKTLNKKYFMVAVPTGFFMATANILQKIGLQYTTPTHYAFLENLSCVAVPVFLFFFIKKKPVFLTILAAVLCLFASFVLSGMSANLEGASLHGDILCALAGIFYGVNIAGTGAFAKKLYAPLYLMIQMCTEMIVSSVGAAAFHITGIEKIKFSFDWRLIIASIIVALITSTLCWIVRTNAMKHVDATVVSVMMPLSSIVTTFVSILAGKDTVTINLIIGVVLGLTAAILSGIADEQKKVL